nr:uncharacterized protein LOC112492390 [Ziziphus jujuba var. spinosa]
MIFNFGGRGGRFTLRDFTIITGLRFGYEPNRRVNISTCISDTYFGGKRKVTNSEITKAFMTAQCQDDDEADDDRLKLTLLYFLETVLLGKESIATASYNHLEIVDDLKYFNNYPWGTLSYTTTIRSLKSAFERRESMALNKSKSYSVCGFPLAFMIWDFETIPSLGQAFEKKLPNKAFPRILNWHISQVPRFEKATELFNHRDYPVHGLMNVTEFERAYIGKIAWDVYHDTTPYSVAPAVQDKPPQGSHGEKDEGVPLTSSGRSKK